MLPLFVSPKWLADSRRSGAPRLRVVDCSSFPGLSAGEAAVQFASAHVPGARLLVYDEEAWRVGGKAFCPRPAVFRRVAASLGVDDTSTVVLYTRDAFCEGSDGEDGAGGGEGVGSRMGEERGGGDGGGENEVETGYAAASPRASARSSSSSSLSSLSSASSSEALSPPRSRGHAHRPAPCLAIYKVWWLLQHYGVRSCAILAGGLRGWTRAGYPLETSLDQNPLGHMGLRSGGDPGNIRAAGDVLAYFGGFADGLERPPAGAEPRPALSMQSGVSSGGDAPRGSPLKRLEALISGSSAGSEARCASTCDGHAAGRGGQEAPRPPGASRISSQKVRFVGRLLDTRRGASLRDYARYLDVYRSRPGAEEQAQRLALEAMLRAEAQYRSLAFADLEYTNLALIYRHAESIGREQATGPPSRIRYAALGPGLEKAISGCGSCAEACSRLEERKVLFCSAHRLLRRAGGFSPASRKRIRRHFHLDRGDLAPDDFVTFVGDDFSSLAFVCFCWCFATGASMRTVSVVLKGQLELLAVGSVRGLAGKPSGS